MRNRVSLTVLFSSILAYAAALDNSLTSEEADAGYDLLFNGTDVGGWHGYRTDTVPNVWFVKTDVPLGPRIQSGSGISQSILTDKKFKNFDLKFDVQIPLGGFSGVFVRYEENFSSSSNSRTGPEMQICGSSHNDCVRPSHQFGACYDMFAVIPELRNSWFHASGSWNQMRIIAYDSNIVHYGNGNKLLEYKLGTPEFMSAYMQSIFAYDGNNGRYYDIHPGSILLQYHSETGTTFRNFKARELTAHPFHQEFRDGKWPDSLPQEFVFTSPISDLNQPVGKSLPEITSHPVGQTAFIVQVEMEHSGFEVRSLDGRTVAFRKTSGRTYRVEKGMGSAGLIIVRIHSKGRLHTQILGVP
ncbi:MAG: DUF1080 domain-containing protein [Fibrobacteria bacterium]